MSPRRRNARPEEAPLYTLAQHMKDAAMWLALACSELERAEAHGLMNEAYGLRNRLIAEQRRLMAEARATGEVKPCETCGGSGKAPDGRVCKLCGGSGLVSRDGLRLPDD